MALLFIPLLFAGLCDFRSMTIPNSISLLVAAGFAIYAINHWGQFDLSLHLMIAGILFIVTYGFWLMGWLGGGDVKLLTAVGLWPGPGLALPFVLYLAVTSTAISLVLIIIRRLHRNHKAPPSSASMRRLSEIAATGACPYGIPICLAACATLPRLFF